MRSLPDFCQSDDLLIPEMSPMVRDWLSTREPAAVETLSNVGIPCHGTNFFTPLFALHATARYDLRTIEHWDGVVGRSVVFAQEVVGLDPSRREWVIAESGAIVLCLSLDHEWSCRFNDSYDSFLICATALDRFVKLGWPGAEVVRHTLEEVDPSAFANEQDPWPSRIRDYHNDLGCRD